MYKLVIAEDVDAIRKVLTKCIKWERIGVEVCKSAATGKEALDYISENGADILITDIRMPVMNGLELIMEVKRVSPNIECVIISAYDNFNYAKNAIQLGVRRYVLKPIDMDEITQAVEDAVSCINERIETQKKIELFELKKDDKLRNNDNKDLFINTENKKYVKIIENTLKYINNTDCSLLNIKNIAEHINLNAKYLSSIFQEVTGKSLFKYITEYKMRKSAEYLKNPSFKIYEICEMIGYSDVDYFRNVFVKHYGINPTEYQKKYL